MEYPDLKTIPQSPGVYLFRDKRGRSLDSARDKVLYVGKAKSLKNRLQTYFSGAPSAPLRTSPKVQALLARADKVEWITTDNELEALLLENNLIKEHRPPFNVVLRDDKNYLYLKITLGEDYPRLLLIRQAHHKSPADRVFGPYTSSRDLRRTLSLLKRLFPLCSANYLIREADIKSGKQKKKPCLNYHLGRCLGPCVSEATSAEYKRVVGEVIGFLQGDYEGVLKKLDGEMRGAAEARKFERAAYLRDQKKSLERMMEEQKVVLPNAKISRDIFGLARALNQVVIAVLIVRQGRLLDQKLIAFEDRFESSEEEILARALSDYYERTLDLPKEIILPREIDRTLKLWLHKKAGRKLSFHKPKSGSLKKIVELARKNATYQLFTLSRHLSRGNIEEELAALKSLLQLKKLARIEAYDISHLSGTNAVGSMVVFLDGVPTPAHYRRFKIKLAKPADDFGAILEILKRRFKKLTPNSYILTPSPDASFAAHPDLVLIDGGRGQLNVALPVLKTAKVKVIALAKKQEEIFVPGRKKSISLPEGDPARRLLERIRDEAHRFAISYQIKLRGKTLRSALEEIPGIGAGTRQKLIRVFGSLAGVKKASLNEIEKVVGASKARVLKRSL